MFQIHVSKLKCFSAQRSSQGETLQKQQRDLEFCSEKEERLKKEIEVCSEMFELKRNT